MPAANVEDNLEPALVVLIVVFPDVAVVEGGNRIEDMAEFGGGNTDAGMKAAPA